MTGFTERLVSFNARLWLTYLMRYGMTTSDLAPHREIVAAIVAAIVAGDADSAESATRRHVAIDRERMRLAL